MAAKQEVTFIISARDRTRAIFRRIRRGIGRMRVGLGSLLAGGAFAALTRGALNFATAIEGASARLDVSSETLQGLKIQAEDLNIPFQTLQGVIQRISRNAGQALAGDTTMADNFRRLGISMEELQNLNTEDLFFAVADAAADTTRSWRETSALIAKVGDTEAVSLRGLLVQGGDALASGVNALKDADRLQGPEALKAAAEAEAAARRELITAQKAFTEAVTQLIPVLQAFTTAVAPLSQGFGDTIGEGRRTGGFGLGAALFNQFGAERNVSGTLEDPEIKALLARTAKATEKVAETPPGLL